MNHMTLKIVNKLDTKLTNAEATDGAMSNNLVERAEKLISEEETYNPS